MSKDKRPFKTEDCDGCICIDWVLARNQRGFCICIVKQPEPEEDVLRVCFLDVNSAASLDVRLDEALTIAEILTMSVTSYIRKMKEQLKNGKIIK